MRKYNRKNSNRPNKYKEGQIINNTIKIHSTVGRYSIGDDGGDIVLKFHCFKFEFKIAESSKIKRPFSIQSICTQDKYRGDSLHACLSRIGLWTLQAKRSLSTPFLVWISLTCRRCSVFLISNLG